MRSPSLSLKSVREPLLCMLAVFGSGVVHSSAQFPEGTTPGQHKCARIEAQHLSGTGLEDGSTEQAKLDPFSDTASLQQALDACPPGGAVRLMRREGGPEDTFFSGPLHIGPAVTLELDAGVELLLSPDMAGTALIETSDGARIQGPGLLSASSSSAETGGAAETPPDLIRSEGSLELRDLTLLSGNGVAIHHLTRAPLVVQRVSVRAAGSPLTFEDPTTPFYAAETTFSSAAVAKLPDSSSFRDVRIYGGEPWRNHCVLLSGQECAPAELPIAIGRLYLTSDGNLSAVITHPEARTPETGGKLSFFDNGRPIGSAVLRHGFGQLKGFKFAPEQGHVLSAVAEPEGIVFELLDVPARHPRLQKPSVTTLSTSATRFTFGSLVALTSAVVPSDANGQITLTDNGQGLAQITLAGGHASFSSDTFSVGAHTIVAAYAGDSSNSPSESPPLAFVILARPVALTFSSLPAASMYGDPVSFVVTASPSSVTGTVSLQDNTSGGQTRTLAQLSNGAATFTLNGLAVGPHTLIATYSGDPDDQAATSSPTVLSITATPSTLFVFPLPPETSFGDLIEVRAELSPASATGTISVVDAVAGVVAQGAAAPEFYTSFSQLASGPHQIRLSYSGDQTHSAATSSGQTVFVTRALTSTSLGSLPGHLDAGTPLMLTAFVAPAEASGSVSFLDAASGELGQAKVVQGRASLTVPNFDAGTHSLWGAFLGGSDYAPSRSPASVLTVSPRPIRIAISALASSFPFGTPVTLQASLVPKVASGTLAFEDGGLDVGSVLISDGAATLTLSGLAVGPHAFAARFSGDAKGEPAASPSVLTSITQAVTRTDLYLSQSNVLAGTNTLCDIKVSTVGSSPSGTVSVRSGMTLLGASTLTDAQRELAYATVQLNTADLTVGSHPLVAYYSGDQNHSPSDSSQAPTLLAIIPSPASGVLVLSKNPVAAGAIVDLSASVLGSPPFAGSVTFYKDGAAVYMTVPLPAEGKVSIELPALRPGTFVWGATVSLSGTAKPIALEPVVLTVEQPFDLALTPSALSLIPGAAGESMVHLTARNDFSGPVSLSCTPLAIFLQCSVESTEEILSGASPTAATPVHVKVSTVLLGTNLTADGRPLLPLLAPTAMTAALLLLSGRVRPRVRLWPLLVAFPLGTLLLAGCGAGYFNVIRPGLYSVLVSAHGGNTTLSKTLSIAVGKAP